MSHHIADNCGMAGRPTQTASGQRIGAMLEGFLTIHVQSLRVDSVVEFDLYSYSGREMVLYRGAHFPFTAELRETLLENGVRQLYVPVEQRRGYQKYVETHINTLLTDPSLDEFTKSSIVYDSAKSLVKDVMKKPAVGENIQRSQALVESMVMYILGGSNVFYNMLRVMSFDYSVYTHSVNVCTFSLALANVAGLDSTTDLAELGTGALLHDVGKIKIADSILHKPGPLAPEEMEAIKNHPRWGVELIEETNLIPQSSYQPIRQHHEREDSSGYPDGIGGASIHVFGKIVAIADMFDAMTTERVYRRAVGSFTALKTMFAEKHRLDDELLEHFVQLMGPTHLADI